MAAAIFLSAVGVVSIARDERVRVSGPVLAGLAGFTAFAASTFTYFLGRSHPNCILVLIVPVCAFCCLWASVFLPPRGQDYRAWRVVPVALVLVITASLTVVGFPFAVQRWHQTAFAQAVPFADGHLPGHGGPSLRTSLEELWAGTIRPGSSASAETFDDSMADHGAMLLQRYDPGDGPALVVLPQSPEILLKARRVNLLPVNDPLDRSCGVWGEWIPG
jgi:hypothetical protein